MRALGEFAAQVYIPSRLQLSERAAGELMRAVRQFASFCGGGTLDDLTDENLCRWMKSRLAAGDSEATVNAKRAKIIAVWNLAWRRRLVAEPPRDVPRLKEPTDPPEARSVADLERLLRYCATLRGEIGGVSRRWWWTSLFLVLWSTAARVASLLDTPPVCYSPTAGRVRVKGRTTKTRAGRVYSLRPEAIAALDRVYDPRGDRIWPWPHCRRWFFVSCRRIMERAGLECRTDTKDLTYSIKRSSLSYTAAVDLELARKQAGHASVATTLRYYIDPAIADERQAADVLPALTF